ncbi:MAG: LysR family transcriptional regulator [Clostridia bacterium]|nr:LysR family transcriptional regulator [Clostridia bacterium]
MDRSDINLNLYKTFYEVAKSGSISAASKHLYVSQPATSRAIKKLEEQLNITLFYRNLNGMELTHKGKELLFYIEEAYNSLLIGERNIREDDSLTTGRLSIGVPSHIGRFFIFDKIAEFHKLYPNIQISIISRPSSEIMTLLANHEIDFAIDSSPIDITYANLKIVPLGKVKHCFFANKNSKIKGIDKIEKLSDLKDLPLVLPVSRSFHRKALNKLALEEDCEFSNVLSIETSEMIITAAKRDIGIGYVIRNLVEADIESGEFVEILVKEALPEIEINLLYIDKYITKVPKKYIQDFMNVKIK